MTTNKDFKRLVRERMSKTGESYTTARARLLEKSPARPSDLSPEELATLAGMRNEAVEKATGHDWAEWVERLDDAGAKTLAHAEIARHIQESAEFSGWWAQTVTVGYERIKGLREIGQRRDGSYDVNKSRTLPVPLGTLYRAFSDASVRATWLPGVELTVRKETPDKSMRITWEDGTPLDVYFYSAGERKSRVTVQHRRLESSERVEAVKSFWTDRLSDLARRITTG